ncbi:diguanylate cyclase [Azoarcus sp. KH32C]|uniref:diguanylate cyclase n=1 Tax=Azoarcus sp. KH32C TaxID=748247 RepID=UPI0002385E5E|nr:diguanylate cyclase [Azoarcus sp. KH32C]BAL22363.1 hypothetical protein AZKH_0011 [Azoarcus sp. KH32C]
MDSRTQPPTGHGLNADALRAVFPFHFSFAPDLTIQQIGPTLQKLLPDVEIGHPVASYLRIVTPNIPFEYAAIDQQSFTVFFLEALDKRFKLKGQMLRTQEDGIERMLFLGSPVVREMSSVSGIGLTLKDFAIHDSAVDFLILLQTKTNTINDVKGMADRLKKEVAERREAQKELQRANEELEDRVRQRTLELEIANSDLQKEIGERRKAEEQVRDTNGQLKAMVRRLEAHNRQMHLLNTMGDMLQACHSVDETHHVIADSLSKLFPGESGSLALLDDDSGNFRVVAAWGENADVPGHEFTRTDCWGLRRARVHEHDCTALDTACAHVRDNPHPPGCQYVCIPLGTQGELHGLLHLHGVPTDDREDPDFANVRRQLIHSASEPISLSIANLKLQENLRQQSIRDALTGLYNRRHMEESLAREIARTNRTQRPCSVIMLDVDHFKKFNDAYGHQAGDALLRGLGEFLRTHVRSEDIPCRYGGEEFILILTGANFDGAAKRAEEIRRGVEQDFKVPHEGGFLPQVTISLGVATYPLHAAGAADTVKAADVALYQSKQDGRNRVTISSGSLVKE